MRNINIPRARLTNHFVELREESLLIIAAGTRARFVCFVNNLFGDEVLAKQPFAVHVDRDRAIPVIFHLTVGFFVDVPLVQAIEPKLLHRPQTCIDLRPLCCPNLEGTRLEIRDTPIARARVAAGRRARCAALPPPPPHRSANNPMAAHRAPAALLCLLCSSLARPSAGQTVALSCDTQEELIANLEFVRTAHGSLSRGKMFRPSRIHLLTQIDRSQQSAAMQQGSDPHTARVRSV
eukprot:COSAG01_NODE_2168_length_8243_cov_2.796442_1_plen_235_part_10